MTIAYIRAYSENGSTENQQDAIYQFARSKHILIDKWSKEMGNTPQNNCRIGTIIKGMNVGDQLLIADISRLSFRLMEIVKLVVLCMERKVILHSVNERYTFRDDVNSKTLAFTFGLVSEIERKLVSIRTKEALVYTKERGTVLGRPRGSQQVKLLIPYKEQIAKELEDGKISIKALAENYKVSVYGFNRFVKEFLAETPEEEVIKK